MYNRFIKVDIRSKVWRNWKKLVNVPRIKSRVYRSSHNRVRNLRVYTNNNYIGFVHQIKLFLKKRPSMGKATNNAGSCEKINHKMFQVTGFIITAYK